MRQVAEFSIGLFFACLFTFQLIPILVTIGPALVRASVLILIHPGEFRIFLLNSRAPVTSICNPLVEKWEVSNQKTFEAPFLMFCTTARLLDFK